MMAHKITGVSLVLVCAFLAQPTLAQRGGGGGGGGGHCGGGGTQSSSNTASSISPYTLNPMANAYAQQQMQQQYAQQAMAMRQMYMLQMENQMLRNQMMQLQNKAQLANAPVNAQGDSNVLLASKKNAAIATKKKTTSKTRNVAQRDKQSDKQKAVEKADTDKIAMNDIN